MSSNTKWVVGVIVVIVVVAVLWFAFGQQTAMTPETPATGGATTETPAPAPAPAPEGGTTGGTTTTQ
jgi:hypothetical protein